MTDDRPVIALTGATGYVGGLLIRPLASQASELRCITRDASRLARGLPERTRPVEADVADSASITAALSSADIAFYMVHSLGEGRDFAEREAEAARCFADAAARTGVKRIIYLGALAQDDAGHTSAHIQSRHSVGEILRSTGVPVTEFRASVVIGAGSMPFEAIRALVERLPVMVTPRWVRMPVQPIAARDLVSYLLASMAEVSDASHVYEIGARDVTTYSELMRAYARIRGLKRLMVPVPVITPRLSSLWLKLVTPAHYRIGKNIVDSTAHSSVVADHSALKAFDIAPMSIENAIKSALEEENRELAFLDELNGRENGVERRRIGTKFVERRQIEVDAAESDATDVIFRIGGENGWFWGDRLWRLRGGMDRVVGGPGLRTDQTEYPPEPGAVLDFWTVLRAGPERLTLKADMRLPGEAWLDLRASTEHGRTSIVQTAAFDPRGVFGIAYWFGLYPLHSLVFGGMLKGMRRAIERDSS